MPHIKIRWIPELNVKGKTIKTAFIYKDWGKNIGEYLHDSRVSRESRLKYDTNS